MRAFSHSRRCDPSAKSKTDELSKEIFVLRNGVADGDRTRDHRNHNPGLYRLSYSHRSV
jgi:hypothetical protein